MADNLSNFLENELLDHAFGKGAYTMPTTVAAALFTDATTDAGGGTEVTGGSYARVAIAAASFNVAAAGSITTNADITFPTASANWGTVTHIAVFDNTTGGNMLWHGILTASKTVDNGDVFKITAGNLTGTLS